VFRPLTKITFLAAGLLVSAGVSFGAALTNGDIFASVGPGLVNEFTPTGVLVQSLNTGHPVYTATGSAFSPTNGDFYVTGFGQNTVVRFSSATGAKVSDFATTDPNSDNESIAFDSTGNAYVGQADGTTHVLEFDSSGALINTFAPATGPRGTDWIDLASDQHTLYYNSEGTTIRRFDTATNTQLADFNVAPLPGSSAYALRILGNGDVLVADSENDYLLDPLGNIIQTYILAGNTGNLFSLNLDPNGTSFWTGDLGNNNVWEVDIATGAIQEHWVASGTGQLAGLSIKGEITAATTPEPSQLVMSIVLVGLLAMVGYWRKRKAAEIV
jgi:WD40 repeat protein